MSNSIVLCFHLNLTTKNVKKKSRLLIIVEENRLVLQFVKTKDKYNLKNEVLEVEATILRNYFFAALNANDVHYLPSQVIDKIGEGSFSDVLKCQDRQTNILYAAKRLKKIYQNVGEILESPELIAMRKLSRHPNVLYMIESHYDPLPGRVTLIFELMEMSLYDLMRKRKGRLLAECRAKTYIYQLIKGLEHLHKHGIFHRDIKPENVLLKGGTVKIGDLGSIRGVYSRPPYTEYISTRWYRSPECLLTGGFYGPKMDIWAVGCVFYELLSLEPLFPGENEVDQIAKIHNILGTPHPRLIAKFRRISSRTRNGDLYFPAREGRGLNRLLPQLSALGRGALSQMLVYDPENRANARALLGHRYFTDLRERETVRQTRSSVLPMNPPETEKWRTPSISGYLQASAQHCRLRYMNACQTRLSCGAEALKSVRSVGSSPNRMLRANIESKAPERPDLAQLRHSHVDRYFLHKRQSLQSNRMNAQPKKWFENSAKISSLRCGGGKLSQRDNPYAKTATVKSADIFQQTFFLNNNDFNMQIIQGENRLPRSNQLPSIFLKNDNNVLNATNSAFISSNSRKVSDRSVSGLPMRKASSTKSPLKKVARRDPGINFLRSLSFDPTKFNASKYCDQRLKFRVE